jgi:hypothetical protein
MEPEDERLKAVVNDLEQRLRELANRVIKYR